MRDFVDSMGSAAHARGQLGHRNSARHLFAVSCRTCIHKTFSKLWKYMDSCWCNAYSCSERDRRRNRRLVAIQARAKPCQGFRRFTLRWPRVNASRAARAGQTPSPSDVWPTPLRSGMAIVGCHCPLWASKTLTGNSGYRNSGRRLDRSRRRDVR